MSDSAASRVLNCIERFLQSPASEKYSLWRKGVTGALQEVLTVLHPTDVGPLVLSPNRFGPRAGVVWVAFLTPEISPSVQSGYYPLLLLDEETRRIYVCLAVAWNQFGRRLSKSVALSKNLEVQRRLLAGVTTLLPTDTLTLSHSAPFARVLEQVCFGVMGIDLDDPTADVRLVAAFECVFGIYAEILATGNPQWLLN